MTDRTKTICHPIFDLGGITENNLTWKWYYNFIRKWSVLHAVKPSGLSELRAKAASSKSIKKYFEELEAIIDK